MKRSPSYTPRFKGPFSSVRLSYRETRFVRCTLFSKLILYQVQIDYKSQTRKKKAGKLINFGIKITIKNVKVTQFMVRGQGSKIKLTLKIAQFMFLLGKIITSSSFFFT